MAGRNAEGYYDPTAMEAVGKVASEEKKAQKTLLVLRTAAQLMAKGAGLELVGRFGLRDPRTGREYR